MSEYVQYVQVCMCASVNFYCDTHISLTTATALVVAMTA